jgi:hypothetical protein
MTRLKAQVVDMQNKQLPTFPSAPGTTEALVELMELAKALKLVTRLVAA